MMKSTNYRHHQHHHYYFHHKQQQKQQAEYYHTYPYYLKSTASHSFDIDDNINYNNDIDNGRLIFYAPSSSSSLSSPIQSNITEKLTKPSSLLLSSSNSPIQSLSPISSYSLPFEIISSNLTSTTATKTKVITTNINKNMLKEIKTINENIDDNNNEQIQQHQQQSTMDTTSAMSTFHIDSSPIAVPPSQAYLSRSSIINFDTINANIQDIATSSPHRLPPPPTPSPHLSTTSSPTMSETSLLSLASMKVSTGNNDDIKKLREELQQQNQRNYMMIPMMMFPSNHPHHQTSQLNELTTATNITNSKIPHFLTDDISYPTHSIDHQAILMAHHHHNLNQSSSSPIFNREHFPNHHHHHHPHQILDSKESLSSSSVIDLTTSATNSVETSPSTGQIPHHTIFRYSHHHNSPYSPSSVISTIGTPPPIHQIQQQQQQQQPTISPIVSPKHDTSNPQTIKSKMINGHMKKISRNDSNSSSSSSSTKSGHNHHHHQQHCKVCGDLAIGKNFGVITCGSCKIFFSRNIDCKERLQCRNNNHCMDSINKSNRRNCSACRLDKCIRLGMRVKRNRQKQYNSQTSIPNVVDSPKIIRNINRSQSESSTIIKTSNHNNENNYNNPIIINNDSHINVCNDQTSLHDSDDDEDDDNEIEINNDQDMNGYDEPMDYADIPSLVPIENDNQGSSEFNSDKNQVDYDLNTVAMEKDEIRRTESIIRSFTNPQRQQPLFTNVSVIQQAPSSVSSVIQTPDRNTINESEDDDEEEEIADTNEKVKNDSQMTSTEIKTDTVSCTETRDTISNGNENENKENNQMLMPYRRISSSVSRIMADADNDDIESIEERTHDGFNYSHVRSSDNAHTRYNYSNFYDENYYKYYYLPPNYYDHNNCYSYDQQCSSLFDDNESTSATNSITRYQNHNDCHHNTSGVASVELCKVEARNFGDLDHTLIADLEKWQPYIRIHMGLDYTTTAPMRELINGINVMSDESNFHHKLFPKEREKIELLNSSCRMISAKPQSHDQLRAIFDSLERGIFYANKSFKLYEEFWCESEISDLIRQNESGFIKKKNNLLHMLYHLRGVQNFDDNLNAWAIFNGVNDNGFTMIKLDMFQQSIKKEMAAAHRQYITSFPQEWRKDPTVFNLMTYLLIFGAFNRHHSTYKCDKLTYFQYLYLFKRYFECMYQNEERAQQMLLWMLKLIRQLSPLCSECLTACTHSLNPAVLKKIGPNYAQCLMMEEKSPPTTTTSASVPTSTSTTSSSSSSTLCSNQSITNQTTN